MKPYVVTQLLDGRFLLIRRRARMGEDVVWSGYATDSRTALQAAMERP
jgi:hypothetical protein